MFRHLPLVALLLAFAGCSPTPMRWEKPGAPAAMAAETEAQCRAAAHQEAIRRLPYGNGPPIYGVNRDMSMLQWTHGIDQARYDTEQYLTKACMRDKGFELVPAPAKAADK